MSSERIRLLAAAVALLILALASAGCETYGCARHSDCDPGLVCSTAGSCELPPDGATAPDASSDEPDSSDVDLADAAPDGDGAGDLHDAAPDADLSDAAPEPMPAIGSRP